MKVKVCSTNFDLMYGNGEKFIQKYGEKLNQYKLKVVGGNRYCTAHITVSSSQKLIELHKVLGEELIIGTNIDTGELYIEIYDDYRN